MCGFIFSNFDNSESIKKISKSLSHRGPDSNIYYNEDKDNLHLHFYRLSINDVTNKGDQPFIDDNLVTVSNCEIYNYKDLKQELLKKGIEFKSNSDAEVIHHGYKIYGESIFNMIQGMFAVLICDLKKQTIFFCRDHIGIKPLYFYKNNNDISVCSEFLTLNKLIQKNNLSNLVDNYLYDFVYKPFNMSNKTIQKFIFKVEPGCLYSINYKSNLLNKKKFWSLSSNSQISKLSLDDKISYFDRLFNDTIKKHLISDVKVGSMLSGGIDSSLITAMAAKYSNQLSTYTIDIENSLTEDDKSSINQMKNLGISNTYVSIKYRDIMNNIEDNIKIYDDLSSSDGGFLSNFFLLKKIKELDPNLKVVLMGDGADEVFQGYNWFRLLKKNYLPKFIKDKIHYYAYNRLTITKGLFNFKFKDNKYYDHQKEFELINQLPNHYLPKVDRSTMYNSLEGRVPFLDQNIIEFGCSLQKDEILRNNITKFFLRKYSEKYLPKEISYKEKKGFGLSSKILMSKDLNKVKDTILSSNSVSNNYFSKRYKENLLKKVFGSHRNNIFSLSNEIILWRIFLADLWYNQSFYD